MIVACAVIALALLVLYLDCIALYSVRRDPTLTSRQRIAFSLVVLLAPVVAALFALHAAVHSAPSSLPSRLWLAPIRWLIRVKEHKPNPYRDDDDFKAIGMRRDSHH